MERNNCFICNWFIRAGRIRRVTFLEGDFLCKTRRHIFDSTICLAFDYNFSAGLTEEILRLWEKGRSRYLVCCQSMNLPYSIVERLSATAECVAFGNLSLISEGGTEMQERVAVDVALPWSKRQGFMKSEKKEEFIYLFKKFETRKRKVEFI